MNHPGFTVLHLAIALSTMMGVLLTVQSLLGSFLTMRATFHERWQSILHARALAALVLNEDHSLCKTQWTIGDWRAGAPSGAQVRPDQTKQPLDMQYVKSCEQAEQLNHTAQMSYFLVSQFLGGVGDKVCVGSGEFTEYVTVHAINQVTFAAGSKHLVLQLPLGVSAPKKAVICLVKQRMIYPTDQKNIAVEEGGRSELWFDHLAMWKLEYRAGSLLWRFKFLGEREEHALWLSHD